MNGSGALEPVHFTVDNDGATTSYTVLRSDRFDFVRVDADDAVLQPFDSRNA